MALDKILSAVYSEVCTPGLMNTDAGVVRAAANLRGWREASVEIGWECGSGM